MWTERERQAGAQHLIRLKTKGGTTTKSFVLFLMRISFKGGDSSHQTRFAFCKGYSVYGKRIGERKEWKLEAQLADYGYNPDEKREELQPGWWKEVNNFKDNLRHEK